MTSYKYEVVYSSKFKKNIKKMKKQNKNIDELLDVVDKLAAKEELEPKYKNHKLVNDKNFDNCMECHIRPDWLLIYQYNDDKLLLLLMNTGSHSDLFD